jgi:endonuclease YncB( thermonuclease family)
MPVPSLLQEALKTAMDSSHSLLQNALILDTETLGLERGSGIHELAIYDFNTRSVKSYVVGANYVEVDAAIDQDISKLATSPLDKHKLIRSNRWMDAIAARTFASRAVAETATDKQIMRALKTSNPFLHRMITSGSAPHLIGKAETPAEIRNRRQLFQNFGINASIQQDAVSVDELFRKGGLVERAIRGRTLWIANAPFESKQIGATVAALQEAGVSAGFSDVLETVGTGSDQLYVTGAAINEARVKAQQDANWIRVWKAYKSNAPKPGETAVRDIQDVLRAVGSYGRELGLLGVKDSYFGTSIDVSFRLLGAAEENKDLAKMLSGFKEVHRAAEDAGISENYVLKRALEFGDVLEAVHERTDLGLKYIEEAKSGTGKLAEAARYFAGLEELAPELLEQNLVRRLTRAGADLLEEGKTVQVEGIKKVYSAKQSSPSGQAQYVPRTIPHRIDMSSLDEIGDFIKSRGLYGGASPDNYIEQMKGILGGTGTKVEKLSMLQDIESTAVQKVAAKLDQMSKNLDDLESRNLGKLVSRFSGPGIALDSAADAMEQMSAKHLLRGWGGAVLAMGAAGFTYSLASGSQEPARQTPSIVTYNYDQWLARQAEFSGLRSHRKQLEGMGHTGIAGSSRPMITDFGSPYQGMQGSQAVFHDQKLLAERERFLRQEYGARHFDPEFGLHGLYGPFKDAFKRQGYDFISGGTPVPVGRYSGLKGGLLEIDLSQGNWKVNVEDADTIVVKRGGIRGGIASMFGMNRGYSFRLAGVDAPETYHGSTSYHAPQPGAEASGEALRQLVEGAGNLKLVYDPDKTTYGRMMGAVIADGKNLNFEIIRRGLGVALPFEKSGTEMIDYRALGRLQEQAVQSNRGIFAMPYYKAFVDITKDLDRPVTFNTLTKTGRLASNLALMDTVSLMEQAQSMGMYNSAMANEAAMIGASMKQGVDKVRPVIAGPVAGPHKSYMSEMQRDVANFVKTKGTNYNPNKLSHRGNYGELDKNLSLDSMSHTNSVWSKRRLQAFENYEVNKMRSDSRKVIMAQNQRTANKQIFANPIQHNRM